MAGSYNAGIVTAYGAAIRGGYTGTYEQFCAQQANYAQTATAVEQAKTDAQAAAQRAQDVADSIPEDYTELTEEVGNLKDDFMHVAVEKNVLNDWEIGGINYSTGNNETSTTACRTAGYYTAPTDTTLYISNPNAQTLGLRIYESDGTYVGSNNITVEGKLLCTAGRRYRIAIAGVNNPNNVTATFNVSVENGMISRKLATLKQSAVKDVKNIFRWIVGSVDGQNGTVSTTYKYRITTPDMIVADEDLIVSASSGYNVGVVTYDGTYHDSGWQTTVKIKKGISFFVGVRKNPEDTTIRLSDPYDSDLYKNVSILSASDVQSADDFWIEKFSNPKELTYEKVRNTSVYSQGACTVNDKILGFKDSLNDHSNTNDIYIYDPTNKMALLGTMSHNLGHCATADYNADVDALIAGNGDADLSIAPEVFIVNNADRKIENGASLLVSDADVFSINFSGIDGYGCGACFGETSDFIYIITSEDPTDPTAKKEYIYRIMLGKGTNDFSSNGFGTYASGKGDNEYNGTAKVIAQYTFNMPGEIQGLKYINGVLVVSTDTSIYNSVLVGYLALLNVTANNIFMKDLFEIPVYKNGSKIRTETEGIAFYKDRGYMSIINSGVGAIISFPVAML